MTVTLYHNRSDNNHVDKNLSEIVTLNGTLRDQCSVLEPTILINADNLSSANYMYIPEFGRYYYITGIVSVRTGLWALTGHVDVLYTYRSEIRGCGAIIARQQNLYNLYLDDDKFLVNAQRMFTAHTFPNRIADASSGAAFVMTVAGGPKSPSS